MQKYLGKLYYIIPICCLFPFFSAPLALFLGILLAIFYKGEEVVKTGKLTKYLLQASIVCMGFSMSVHDVIQTGKAGFLITVVSVAVTMLGLWRTGLAGGYNRKTYPHAMDHTIGTMYRLLQQE